MLKYDPNTGLLFWIESKQGRKKDKPAGTKCKDGYHGICFGNQRIRTHRVVYALVNGVWPDDQIDHKNGDPLDNKLDNLRLATNKQNGKNLRIKSNNTSGVTGVTWDKANNKWRSVIKADGKSISLGRFIKFEDAVKARKNAEIKYFGEWRRQE
jgi:hypothetical protein